MPPRLSTAQPRPPLANATASSWLVVGDVCGDHVPPPLVVPRIVPARPTVQQSVPPPVATQDAASRLFVVPEVCAAQVVPPLLVATIVPNTPVAQQWLTSLHAMPLSWFVVPDVCADHVPAANAGATGQRARLSPASAATRS